MFVRDLAGCCVRNRKEGARWRDDASQEATGAQKEMKVAWAREVATEMAGKVLLEAGRL